MPDQWTVALGEGAEILARPLRDLTRGAGRVSPSRATSAPAPPGTPGSTTARSRPCRTPSSSATRASARTGSLEKLGKLKPGFRKDGTVTAGNSSPLNDGAAALFVGDEKGAEKLGREPLARIVSRAAHGGVAAPLRQSGPWRRPTARSSAPASAGATSTCGAQRGLRGAVARLPGRSGGSSTPRSSTSNGGAIAIGHPTRLLWRAHPRHAGP